MGKNTGDGHRNGQMKDRKQFYNPKTGQYYKINTETGKIMSVICTVMYFAFFLLMPIYTSIEKTYEVPDRL